LTNQQPYQQDGAKPPLAAASFAFTLSFIIFPSTFQCDGQKVGFIDWLDGDYGSGTVIGGEM
jgi:hypothetical protein